MPDYYFMLIFMDFVNENGIILSPRVGGGGGGVSKPYESNLKKLVMHYDISKEVSLYKYVDIISVLWAPSGQPACGITHMGLMRSRVVLLIWIS